jgi:predicted  nucleic acid-binding Zn-ribbon protein
MTNVVHK